MSAEDADAFMAELDARTQELVAQGKPFPIASHLAGIDLRIRRWPPKWGEAFEALIYGDIKAPKASLKHPDLQIEIHPEPLKNTIVSGATCVLRASVAVNEKSFAAVVDATRRLNLLLGSYVLHSWGNSALGW